MATTESEIRPVSDRRDDPPQHDQSTTGLLSKLASDVGELMRGEMHLARAEVAESVNDVKKGAASLVSGGVVLLAGSIILLAALSLGIARLFDVAPAIGMLIVGGVVTIVGAILLKTAMSKLSAGNLAPTRTQASLQKDKRLVEEKAR